MRGIRWKAFGMGVWLAVGIGLIAALIETAAHRPATIGAPGLRDGLYALLLHCAIAVGVTLILRLLAWRADERAFPALALGAMLALELSATANFWVSKAPFTPPFYTTAGRVLVAAGALAGLLLAALAARALHRSPLSAAWARAARGPAGRAGILAAAALAAVSLGLAARAWPRPERYTVREEAAGLERPDVIILLSDALRRDHLSAFGYPRPTSPHIDRLLEESFRFDAAYTPSSWTIPSVASLFTGLYPTAHGIRTAVERVPEDAPLLAEHFRSYGYRTAAFVGNQIVTGSNGYAQGFERFFPPSAPWWTFRRRTAFELIAARAVKPESAAREWRLNQECLRWLREAPGEPHFAYIHYRDPHSPYQPSAADLQAVAPGAPEGPSEPPVFSDYADQVNDPGCRDWECLDHPPTLPADQLEGMVARYDGAIHHVDRRIGALLGELRAMGLLDRAHVILLTDHGEEFGDHQGWHHGHSVYEEMVGSPMAYRPPGGLPGGRRIARPTAMLDLPLTLCRILGFEDPPLHQGRPIPELLGQPVPDRPTPVLAELPPSLYALRLGRWKLVRRGPAGDPDFRLYDLAVDPREQANVAAQFPDTLAVLQGYLEGTLAEVGRVRLAQGASILDPELLQQLKTLGYIR